MVRDQAEKRSSVMARSIGHSLSAGALPARRRGHLAAYAQRSSVGTPTWLPGQSMTAPPAGPRMTRERWKETSSFDSSMVRPSSAGADTALKETVQSWKLPCQVDSPAKLSPATWIVTEANGSLAVQLAASLGYKFNFVRQAKGLGLSGDIGLKIDAAAMATFGFDVSGRFLVVVGRESDDAKDQKIRLRLFKLVSSGMQFGLNLNLSVTGVETFTPNKVDDFVKAVFGVHGAQIVRLLGQVEKWTDPKQNVGQLVAGLANEKALDLFKRVTGEDAEQAFDAARNKLD